MLAILAGWAIAPAIFEASPHFPWEFYSVLAVGFVAAVSLGSVAWYNSKRPAGWEDKERPKVIPKIDQE
jgi:hypothetical protein